MVIEDKKALSEISNFQVFMTVMNEKTTQDKKQAVESIFELMNLGKAVFTPRSIVFTDKNETRMIDENNFEPF